MSARSDIAAPIPRERSSSPRLGRLRGQMSNPWRRPWFLASWTWLYVLWSIVPALMAVHFSFNSGRSRSSWQGFSLDWYAGIFSSSSATYDETLLPALIQSLRIALLTVPIATIIGVALALGLARWHGRGSGFSNVLMLFPLVTPEIVMGVSLFLVFVNLLRFIPLGTTAMVLGHVTFSISYVVIVVRGRLFAIGRDYEEAAMDLGASQASALRRVLLPLLWPAIVSSAFIVFAISIDDSVISAFLCVENCATMPIKIYSAARNASTPGLNALATLMMLISLAAIAAAVLVQRAYITRRGERRSDVRDFEDKNCEPRLRVS